MLEEIWKHAGELQEEWSNVIPDDEGFTVKKWVERGTNLAALALVAVKLSGAKDEQERYLLLLSRHSASYPKPAIALSRNDVIEMASDLKRDWSRATDEDTFGKIVEDLLYFRSLPLVAQFAKKLGDYCREGGNDFDHFLDLLMERASAWLPSASDGPRPSGSPETPAKPGSPGTKPISSSGVSVPVEPSVIKNFHSFIKDLVSRCKDSDFTSAAEDDVLIRLRDWLDDLLATPKAPIPQHDSPVAAEYQEPSLEEFRQSRELSDGLDGDVTGGPEGPGLIYWGNYWIGLKNGEWYSTWSNDEFKSFNLADVEEWLYRNIEFVGRDVWERRWSRLRTLAFKLETLANEIEDKKATTARFADLTKAAIGELTKIRNGEYDDRD